MSSPASSSLPRIRHGQFFSSSPSVPHAPFSLFFRRVVPVVLVLFIAALITLSRTLVSVGGEGEENAGNAGGVPGTGATVLADIDSSRAVADDGAADKSQEEGEEGPVLSRPSKCQEGCLEHGTCNEENGECHCITNYAGPTCTDHALPRCQLAPGYTPPCFTLTTCECLQDCHKFRLPLNVHCLRGTLGTDTGMGALNPNVREVLQGPSYRVPWDVNLTTPLMPDYKVPPALSEPSPLTDPASCPESCNGRGACHLNGFCE